MKILIIDDEPDFLEYLENILLKGFPGTTITWAGDGEEAWEKASRESFDLICVDVHMPKLNGLEFSRRLRQTKGPSFATPIIFISGYADTYRAEAGQLSDTFFVDKPLPVPVFLSIVSLATGVAKA